MMIRMILQFFGGRGSRSKLGPTPSSSHAKWGRGPGDLIADDLKGAIGTKGKPKSISTAIVEANPNWSTDYREFSENCQRVVVAYELLRRGYNVEALPTYQGDTLGRVAYMDRNGVLEGRWKGAFQNAKSESVSADTGEQVLKNIADKMKQYGDNSRAVVQIFYKSGGGHVFNVENNNGRMVYIEAQAGRLKNDDMENLMTNRVLTDSVSLVRTDNLRISERAKRSVRLRRE